MVNFCVANRSAIDECGYSTENQVAAKIVVLENGPVTFALMA
jgi:hypothetical protein